MLERRSALASAKPYTSGTLKMGEVRGFTLLQVSGLSSDFEKKLAGLTGKLPALVGSAMLADHRAILRIGPSQFWIVAPETDNLASQLDGLCAITSLSHSRTRIFLEGAPVRDVLAKGIPLDFHPSAFKPAMFAMTGLHHTPVMIHCISETRFELYAMRTFAMSVWDWLTDAALEFQDS